MVLTLRNDRGEFYLCPQQDIFTGVRFPKRGAKNQLGSKVRILQILIKKGRRKGKA